jgi:hypothetical protein
MAKYTNKPKNNKEKLRWAKFVIMGHCLAGALFLGGCLAGYLNRSDAQIQATRELENRAKVYQVAEASSETEKQKNHNNLENNLENLKTKPENPEQARKQYEGEQDDEEQGSSEEKIKYTTNELREMQKILYAEAADQPSLNRRIIAKLILNRENSSLYPNSIQDVIYQKNAFSCIFDGSELWKQANGKLKMNDYEKNKFSQCREDTEYVLEGNKLNIPRADEIIAYHDISVSIEDLRKKDKFWNSVEEVFRNRRLIYYAYK